MFFDVALKGGDRSYLPWNEFIPLAGVGTHGHDDHKFDLEHLLLIIEDIMKRTTFEIPEISKGLGAKMKTREEGTGTGFSGVMGPFASTITNLSREMTSKLGENEDDKTSRILKALANHSWKTKVVLAIAAFTVKYGKLRLLTLRHTSNPLASTVALLKQQPDVSDRKQPDLPDKTQPDIHQQKQPDVAEQPKYLASWYTALAKLIDAMLALTNCIVQFDQESQRINPERPDMLKGDFRIPTAVYWTINSAVVCSSQIMAVLVMRYKNLAPYEWNLDDLTKTLESMHRQLSKKEQAPAQERADEQPQQQLQKSPDTPQRQLPFTFLQRLCMLMYPSVQSERHTTMSYRQICSQPDGHLLFSNLEDEIRNAEAYAVILNLFNTSLSNNMDILKALIDHQDQPLLDGSTKERVSIEMLKTKTVLLFISDLDLCHEELLKIDEMYVESRKHPRSPYSEYEVVWLPMVDSSMTWTEKRNHFETIQSWMTWYSVYYPSLIKPAAIKYIHEVWQFNGKPLVVVLDSQGNVVNRNAIHMMRIWGNQAFPFSRLREETLWNTMASTIELLLDTIHPMLTDWIVEDKYICLYGGEDREWIRRFTATARQIARATSISLELLYIGKARPTDLVQSNINNIVTENLSHVFEDLNLIKLFWLRLESIVQSRLSVTNSSENDPLTQEIKTLLGFDKDEKAWALITRKGSMLMAKANGEAILESFMNYNQWKDNVADTGFVPALSDYLGKIQNPQQSNLSKSPKVSPGKPPQSNGKFFRRSLSCFADPPTK